MSSDPPGRVQSLDLLRGLCAIAVAVYHVLAWLQFAHLYDLGLYGVYLFFLLSGASMALAYTTRLRAGYPITKYLALRYIRLAPLFAVVATYVAIVDVRDVYTTGQLIGRWFLNVTFLFGFANPGQTSLVTGGWSLGIELVFYIAFPVLILVLAGRRGLWIALGLLALQLIFVNVVLNGTDLEKAWVGYTQFAAFVGYFAFGTWLGLQRVEGRLASTGAAQWGWTAWLALLAAIAISSGATTEGSLTGLRGALLTLACCALLAVTIRLEIPRALRRFSSLLGDASYPMYLLHPIVFGLLGRTRLLESVRLHHRVAFACVAVTTSFVASVAVYRWIELPILRWGRRRVNA